MEIRSLTGKEVLNILPDRDPWGHKGTFGKVLLLCGSIGYTGAAYLAAMGALRSGAGLVYLGVPESIYAIEAIKLNEAIVIPMEDSDGMLSATALPKILKKIEKMDAVMIGCGLGQSEDTFRVVSGVLQHAKCPVVLDADGINVICGHMDIVRRAAEIYERVYLAVMINSEKKYTFTLEQRKRIAEAAAAGMERVEVISSDGYLWRLAEELGASGIVKGYRNESDLTYEQKMAEFNLSHNPNAPTELIPSPKEWEAVSSTVVRKRIQNGLSLTDYLPDEAIAVIEAIISGRAPF